MDPTRQVCRTQEGYLIAPDTQVPSGLRLDDPGRLLIGARVQVDGGVFLAGSLRTQPGVRIGGPVRVRGSIILGPKSQVHGELVAEGDVRCLPGCRVQGRVKAGGDAHLYEGTSVAGVVEAAGDIVVHGTAETRDLRPGGRLRSEPFEESEPLEGP